MSHSIVVTFVDTEAYEKVGVYLIILVDAMAAMLVDSEMYDKVGAYVSHALAECH